MDKDNSEKKEYQQQGKHEIQEKTDSSNRSSKWSFLTIIAMFACCGLPILIVAASTLTISSFSFGVVDIWPLAVVAVLVVLIGYGIKLRRKKTTAAAGSCCN